MFSKLMTYIQYEDELLKTLINIAKEQQKALINYNMDDLVKVSQHQGDTAKKLREAEEKRIKLIMAWFKIPRSKASSLWLSAIEKHIEPGDVPEIHEIGKRLKNQINMLHNLNTTNRVLANRARESINNIVNVLTDGTNHVCNVKV